MQKLEEIVKQVETVETALLIDAPVSQTSKDHKVTQTVSTNSSTQYNNTKSSTRNNFSSVVGNSTFHHGKN